MRKYQRKSSSSSSSPVIYVKSSTIKGKKKPIAKDSSSSPSSSPVIYVKSSTIKGKKKPIAKDSSSSEILVKKTPFKSKKVETSSSETKSEKSIPNKKKSTLKKVSSSEEVKRTLVKKQVRNSSPRKPNRPQTNKTQAKAVPTEVYSSSDESVKYQVKKTKKRDNSPDVVPTKIIQGKVKSLSGEEKVKPSIKKAGNYNKEKSFRISPTGKKIFLTKPNSEELLEDEFINYSLEETEVKAAEGKVPKDTKWDPNNPFILHFLLDGFITDELGNNIFSVLESFDLLLSAMNTSWSLTMKEFLLDGNKVKQDNLHSTRDFYLKVNPDNTRDSILDKARSITNKDDMIIIGGYSGQYGGHAVSFRFQKSLRRITIVNSGSGLRFHKKDGKGKYKLYEVEEYDNDENYDTRVRILISSICIDITNINDTYKYQVNRDVYRPLIKGYKEGKLDFKNKDTGVVKNSRPIYMTDRNNWEIIDGELYCKPQITGTCTFHSIYWQLLLDIWLNKGSKAASEFENYTRELVINSIRIGPYISQISEKISCLGLLLRLYPNIKNKDEAINTILYDNIKEKFSSVGELSPPAFLVISKILSRIELLPKLIESVYNCKYIEDTTPHITNLTNFLYSDMFSLKSNDIILRNFYAEIIYRVTEVVYTDMQVREKTTLLNFRDVCLLFKLIMTHNTHFTSGVLISIIAKIYNNLPEKLKLPSFGSTVYLSYGNYREIDCLGVNFISEHIGYLFNPKKEDNDAFVSKQIKFWKENTPDIKDTNYPIVFDVDYKEETSLVYREFLTKNLIANCVMGIIYGASHINPSIKFDYEVNESEQEDDNLSLFSDLNSGLDISEIEIGVDMGYDMLFTHICDNRKRDDVQNRASYGFRGNANIKEYNKNKIKWMQKAILKGISQLGKVFTNEKIMNRLVTLTLRLWKDGPTQELSDMLKSFIEIKNRSPGLNILLGWAIDPSYLPTSKDMMDYFPCELLLVARYIRDINGLMKVIKHWLTAPIDANPDINIPKVIGKYKALVTPKLYPKRLWLIECKEEEVSYVEDGKMLYSSKTIPRIEHRGLEYYLHKAREVKLPSCLWKKGEEISLEIESIKDERYFIYNNYLVDPTGNKYKIKLIQDTPYLMRPWCYGYIFCLSIPLQREGKWYIFMAGSVPKSYQGGCFDRKSYTDYFAKNDCYIFEMNQTCLFPMINRNSESWRYLYSQIVSSSKTTCIALIYDIVDKISRDINEGEIGIRGTPRFNAHKSDRTKYTKFLDYSYDLPIPKDGSFDYKLACAMAGSVYKLEIDRLLPLLVNLMYKNSSKNIPKLRKSQAMFEAITGKFLYPHQEELILAMKEDLFTKQSKVRIALMGIGKTKIIVPMLIIICLLNDKKIQVVQPAHLVSQTGATLDEIIPILPNINYDVISDTKAKADYLTSKIEEKKHDNNMVTLFDEIDSMYNCFKSSYNIPSNEAKHPLEDMPLDLYYHMIVRDVYDEKVFLDISNITKRKEFINKYKANMKLARDMKYKYNYGMAENPKELIAVPYSSVDTPVPGSMFSDIDLTAILTCLTRLKGGLTVEDCRIMLERFKYWNEMFDIKELEGINIREVLKLNPDETKSLMGNNRVLQMLYLENILLPAKLKCHRQQYNISFIDLMSEEYSIQRIGFSGTDAIHLPEFKRGNWIDIIPDYEGEKKIKEAILGWGKEKDKVFSYTLENMWKQLQNYDVLIDADALLREEGSTLDIVKRWSEEVKGEYLYVYLDNKHNPLVYDPLDPKRTSYYIYNSRKKYKHYFDQKHTVGIDLKLHPKVRALTLVSKDSKLVDVAQAIYRLRQIDKNGQTTDFMIENVSEIINREKLYNLIKENDDKFKMYLLPEHFIQNAKTVDRLAINKLEKYKEIVKYYDTDANKYKYEDSLAKEIFNEGKDLDRGNNPLIELQVEQEQEEVQEQEQEQKREHKILYPGKLDCSINIELMTDVDYLDVTKGRIFKDVKILVSSVLNELEQEYKTVEYCFIELEDGYYKVISLGEALLLQARGKINPKYHYRYDPVDEKTPALFLLAQALCGRKLHIDEQLKVIKNITNKEDINKIASCYRALNYGVMADYINSTENSEEFIKSFKKEYDYQTFLIIWLNLNSGNKFTKNYYDKCMNIIR